MALQSMTGFARREGAHEGVRWIWELRSVNGKGLDVRLRMPPGHERLEGAARGICAAAFSRGSIQVGLTVHREAQAVEAVVNEAALEAVLAAAAAVGERLEMAPPRLDGILALRGVIELREPEDDGATLAARDAACLADLEAAVEEMAAMRRSEGAALRTALAGHVDAIAALVERIAADPSLEPAAIRERLRQQVALLMDSGEGFDAQRLHAEAALLATKADLTEEIDRLKAHVEAARALLDGAGPVGRRLDFLSQEFNRESNTICAKSNAVTVTNCGMELKVAVDRLREQVQNLE